MLVNKSVQREMDAALVFARCRLVHRYILGVLASQTAYTSATQIACDTAPMGMVGSGLRARLAKYVELDIVARAI